MDWPYHAHEALRMSDLEKILAARIAEIDVLLARIEGQMTELRTQQLLERTKRDAFSAALDIEMGKTPRPALLLDHPSDSEGEDDSAADAGRRLIVALRDKGVKPSDLSKFYRQSGMKIGKNYVYGLLIRLRKKTEEIEVRNGRYYPTEALVSRMLDKEGRKVA
jgi:hypothetical protein